MKYSQTLIDDEYESSNIASQKELRSISGNINLNHTTYGNCACVLYWALLKTSLLTDAVFP